MKYYKVLFFYDLFSILYNISSVLIDHSEFHICYKIQGDLDSSMTFFNSLEHKFSVD